MEQHNTQVMFFQHIKSILPPHLSFVDEIAGLLDISNDSAYRRIRGEKQISLDELQKLASHYRVSIDQLLHIKSDSFIFAGDLAPSDEDVFEKWMGNVYRQITMINSFNNKHIYYLAKDVPIMQQFMAPDLFAFKSFLWRRSILQYNALKGLKFSLKDAVPLHTELAKKIEEIYTLIPTTEVWNLESINSTIRQIEFYREADMFETEEDVKRVYDSLLSLINHLEKQAETGLKSRMGAEPLSNAAPYNLFWNDLVLGDNTILTELDGRRITFLNHSVINFVHTTDERFNDYTYNAIQNLMKRSTQLSNVGEKERYRFFNRMRDKMKLAARL